MSANTTIINIGVGEITEREYSGEKDRLRHLVVCSLVYLGPHPEVYIYTTVRHPHICTDIRDVTWIFGWR